MVPICASQIEQCPELVMAPGGAAWFQVVFDSLFPGVCPSAGGNTRTQKRTTQWLCEEKNHGPVDTLCQCLVCKWWSIGGQKSRQKHFCWWLDCFNEQFQMMFLPLRLRKLIIGLFQSRPKSHGQLHCNVTMLLKIHISGHCICIYLWKLLKIKLYRIFLCTLGECRWRTDSPLLVFQLIMSSWCWWCWCCACSCTTLCSEPPLGPNSQVHPHRLYSYFLVLYTLSFYAIGGQSRRLSFNLNCRAVVESWQLLL